MPIGRVALAPVSLFATASFWSSLIAKDKLVFNSVRLRERSVRYMARHGHAILVTPWVLMNPRLDILLLVGSMLMGCGGCAPEKPSPAGVPSAGSTGPAQAGGSTAPAQPTPGHPVLDAGRRTPSREGNPMFEIAEGPINRRMYLQAGKPDFANRYITTVMITSQEPLEGAECSGLLVSPEVVLTAASCVCKSLKAPDCVELAYASTVVYNEVIREDLADFRVRFYRGVVHPHPEFRLTLDDEGFVVSSSADLAVIVLEVPVELELAEIQFWGEELKADEHLHMAGYGYGAQWGQLYGMRFIRKDKIKKATSPGEGRVVYEQQGAFLYNGFHGGPCFRENESGRWLVGITSIGTERELAFTRIYPYQGWLRAEIQRATNMARGQRRE